MPFYQWTDKVEICDSKMRSWHQLGNKDRTNWGLNVCANIFRNGIGFARVISLKWNAFVLRQTNSFIAIIKVFTTGMIVLFYEWSVCYSIWVFLLTQNRAKLNLWYAVDTWIKKICTLWNCDMLYHSYLNWGYLDLCRCVSILIQAFANFIAIIIYTIRAESVAGWPILQKLVYEN